MTFISLVFALFKAGAVIVLIDPGMGRTNLVRCLSDADPQGFIAIPLVHAIRVVLRHKFPRAQLECHGRPRRFWGGRTLDELRRTGRTAAVCHGTTADDPAAIIFTTAVRALRRACSSVTGISIARCRNWKPFMVSARERSIWPPFPCLVCSIVRRRHHLDSGHGLPCARLASSRKTSSKQSTTGE